MIELGVCHAHNGMGGTFHYHADANCLHWHPDEGETILDYDIMRLSLSKMTMPHELASLVLVEQIYRATEINKGSNYHKNLKRELKNDDILE